METLLFFAPPALLVLIGLKGQLMTGWRLFVCGGCALYLGVWLTPQWYGLLDFFPSDIEGYRIGVAVVAGTLTLFCIFFKATLALAQRRDDEFSFPQVPSWVLNALCRMCFGIFLSTLIFLVFAATPLRASLRNNGDGFEAMATASLRRITAVGDTLTFFTPEKPRSEALASFWYAVPENAEKAAAPEAAQANAEKTRAPEAAPKKQ